MHFVLQQDKKCENIQYKIVLNLKKKIEYFHFQIIQNEQIGFMIFMQNISKNLKGKNTCDNNDIITMIDTAMSTIQERGKTKVGDKTILDTLDFISRNLKVTKDNINYPELFKLSTNEALNAFKGKKILIGRARMFEDKTKDLDDPGMLALHKLSEAFQ